MSEEEIDYEHELLKIREDAVKLVLDVLREYGLSAIEDVDWRKLVKITLSLVDEKITFEDFENELQEILIMYKDSIKTSPSKLTVLTARQLAKFIEKVKDRLFSIRKRRKKRSE